MTTRGDRKTFRNEDLVLKVDMRNIDPQVWDENRYEPFLDELCGVREYQKIAIRAAAAYWLGDKYRNLRELAKKNFDSNDEIQQRYGSWAGMERHLQFPDQLSCSLDLATGTGKSYVLYGLAAILLAEGKVDRVLVLCPSNTIEAGLLDKFKEQASRAALRDSLPPGAVIRTPKIINASQSIVKGAICIENYHAILKHVKSSIRDSLKSKGARVAVFSDEAHHATSESATRLKRWKEFILDKDFGFKYVLGVSGTCYVGDEYFSDVISRYSLRQAIEEHFVKRVEYVAEMPKTDNPDEKWQLIYNRHKAWKNKLKNRKIRPLSIIITRDIARCKRVAEELQAFLGEWEKKPAREIANRVLPVTSAREHQVNIVKLKTVDHDSSKVEWIVSVAMLTEGWDVKNVFQIVPHEERAFNSKLLIAQVLGRGLRRPDGWKGDDPIVTIFNHDAWSGRIRHLVNEILEIERRLSSAVVKSSSHHFDLHTLDYTRSEKAAQFTKKGEYSIFKQGYIDLPTQVETEHVSVEFERVVSGSRSRFDTQIKHRTYSIQEVAEAIFGRFESIDKESKEEQDHRDHTQYAKRFPLEKCEEIVQATLKRAKIKTGRVTESNRQKFLQALGSLRRKKSKKVIYALQPKNLIKLNTKERPADSCSAAELRRGSKTIFYGPDCKATLPEEQVEFFEEVQDPDGDFRAGREEVANAHDFKTPTNVVIADGTPERRFVRDLCKRINTKVLESWFKNTNQRFYFVEYAWKKRNTNKRGEFSPDFIIKIGKKVHVIEIKDDDEISEPSLENQKKNEYAQAHFERLNKRLERENIPTRYQFNFLTPSDYNKFFQLMREKKLKGFRSELDVALKKVSDAAAQASANFK